MNVIKLSFLRRFLKEQCGQSMVIVAVTLATVMAVAGASVETGHVYYAYRELVWPQPMQPR